MISEDCILKTEMEMKGKSITELKTNFMNYCNRKDDCMSAEEMQKMQEQLISEPKTCEEKSRNEKFKKKIAYEKAKSYFLSGKCDSVREAAKQFDVSHTTLSLMLKTGKCFQGKGKKTLIFTEEEEKRIANRIIEKLGGARELTSSILREVIREELEVLKVNFPGREDINTLLENSSNLYSFVLIFAKRNGLKKYYPEDNKERNYECDICFKRFTFKNSMVSHRKTVHSFLY